MKIKKSVDSATNSCGIPAKPSTVIEEATYDDAAEQINEDYITRVMSKVDEELPDTFVTFVYDTDSNMINCTSASPFQIAEYLVPADDLSGMIDEDAEYILGAIRDYKEENESIEDELVADDRYEFIDSKIVLDADGFNTEYTMYYDTIDDRYVFIFGDRELYSPYDGEGYFDFECETEEEAREWFDDYRGPGEDFDEYEEYHDFSDWSY